MNAGTVAIGGVAPAEKKELKRNLENNFSSEVVRKELHSKDQEDPDKVAACMLNNAATAAVVAAPPTNHSPTTAAASVNSVVPSPASHSSSSASKATTI